VPDVLTQMPVAEHDLSSALDPGACAARRRYDTPHIHPAEQSRAELPGGDTAAPTSTRRRSTAEPHRADLAQARIFIDILQPELAELQALAARVEARAQQQRPDDNMQLSRMQARLNEVRELLAALEYRFPTA
jgi:hypothetical protein